jgi:hypothetical protein
MIAKAGIERAATDAAVMPPTSTSRCCLVVKVNNVFQPTLDMYLCSSSFPDDLFSWSAVEYELELVAMLATRGPRLRTEREYRVWEQTKGRRMMQRRNEVKRVREQGITTYGLVYGGHVAVGILKHLLSSLTLLALNIVLSPPIAVFTKRPRFAFAHALLLK